MNNEMITSLVDKVIKVDRGGPESRLGRLLAAEKDYFTLLHDDEGIIYYNTQHIKSVTYNSKSQADFDYELPRNFKYVHAPDFKGILQKLTLLMVKINRGGPETLEGVMDVVTDNFVTIVANEDGSGFPYSTFAISATASNSKKKADGKKDKNDH